MTKQEFLAMGYDEKVRHLNRAAAAIARAEALGIERRTPKVQPKVRIHKTFTLPKKSSWN